MYESFVDPIHYAWARCNKGVSLPQRAAVEKHRRIVPGVEPLQRLAHPDGATCAPGTSG